MFQEILNIYIPLFVVGDVISTLKPHVSCTQVCVGNNHSTSLHVSCNQFTNINPNHVTTTQNAVTRDENASLDAFLGMFDKGWERPSLQLYQLLATFLCAF